MGHIFLRSQPFGFASGWGKCSSLLAENLDPRAVVLVHVDGEIAELIDEFVEVLGLDIAKIDLNALMSHGEVCLLHSGLRDQAGEFYAGAQQLHGHADIDVYRTPSVLAVAVLDHYT